MVLQGTLAVCSTLAALVVGYSRLPMRTGKLKLLRGDVRLSGEVEKRVPVF